MELAEIFTNHMVLQQGADIPVWGKGDGPVTVTLNGTTVSAKVRDGKWFAILPKQAAGGPYQMIIDGPDESISLDDLLVGEVWIAGGQSNMEMPLFCTENCVEDVKTAKNDKIRFYCVPRRPYKDARVYNWHFERCYSDVTAWKHCTPENTAHFTAIGYYFAKKLYETLNVPIGIISCNWGGTKAEWWIDEEYLKGNPQFAHIWNDYQQRLSTIDSEEYEQQCAAFEQESERFTSQFDACDLELNHGTEAVAKAYAQMGPWPQEPFGYKACSNPATLYHTMVEEIVPFAVKGVLWYQGESNTGKEECGQYADLFALLVQNWRDAFKNLSMPFYAVQLAPFADVAPDTWETLREQQVKAMDKIENYSLVGTIDAGDAVDIHPKKKAIVGSRLADLALRETYGLDFGEYQGPICKDVQFERDCAVLSFAHTGGGLVIEHPLDDIELCGTDHIYHPAKARVEGERLIVSSPDVETPVAVRYGWRSVPSGGLYNGAGYPAYPFRIGDF